MGEPILCYGKSGSGKSRSLKNFGEDEILFINTISKRLPFPKKFKYELRTKNYALIKDKLAKMPCKVAVVDDAGYLMTSTFMAGHSTPKKGGSTFDLFNQIGDEFWDLILFVKERLPEDVFVYFMMMHLGIMLSMLCTPLQAFLAVLMLAMMLLQMLVLMLLVFVHHYHLCALSRMMV